jgi:1-acyl-sn-glycerol-3-phosphate acyltransferase
MSIANGWVALNLFNQKLFCNIDWDVRGTNGLRQKGWYLVLANHQSWVDILVLQSTFYRKIPFLKFFLKKELFWLPILGQCWWALEFPFMKRYSLSYLKKHPERKGKDYESTRIACQKFKTIPVSIMNFVEGTRFTQGKHTRQKSPFNHLLKPRAGGIAFVLSTMGEHLHQILDVTIVYPQGFRNFWAFVRGDVGTIKVRVKAIPITRDLLGDYSSDKRFRLYFHKWLNNLWAEKDMLIQKLLSQP